ncbi:hypothetical protein BC826DRAFT_1157124 [Russula brevipes]|nr:hypothetical protein BC826DRAFT_1157124 [Russula brevipes]
MPPPGRRARALSNSCPRLHIRRPGVRDRLGRRPHRHGTLRRSPAIQEKKYAFKCHRQTADDIDHVWPVNGLAFDSTYNIFAWRLEQHRLHLRPQGQKWLR